MMIILTSHRARSSSKIKSGQVRSVVGEANSQRLAVIANTQRRSIYDRTSPTIQLVLRCSSYYDPAQLTGQLIPQSSSSHDPLVIGLDLLYRKLADNSNKISRPSSSEDSLLLVQSKVRNGIFGFLKLL